MEIRLLKALSLLRDPDAKIINIAEQWFHHLGLFNACFKKRFGDTPGQWRKRAANGEPKAPVADVGHPLCPMHSQGLCPWTPDHDNGNEAARTASAPRLGRPDGPANRKLRESILREIHDVSAKLACKSNLANTLGSLAASP